MIAGLYKGLSDNIEIRYDIINNEVIMDENWQIIRHIKYNLQINEKVTAPDLAEHFEVSRRTINRDIEVLCRAGIPIVTQQGQGGGISIMNGYKLDKALLTEEDLSKILTGLNAVNSIEQ